MHATRDSRKEENSQSSSVRAVDSISRPEFHGIFDRVSMDVELKGATTAVGIENRLRIARHYAKTKAKAAKKWFMRKSYGFRAEELDKLIEHDFAGRSIHEAIVWPIGKVADTLLYGREEALRFMHAHVILVRKSSSLLRLV